MGGCGCVWVGLCGCVCQLSTLLTLCFLLSHPAPRCPLSSANTLTSCQHNTNHNHRGVASWDWFYPYHYAPMAQDMRQLGDIDGERGICYYCACIYCTDSVLRVLNCLSQDHVSLLFVVGHFGPHGNNSHPTVSNPFSASHPTNCSALSLCTHPSHFIPSNNLQSPSPVAGPSVPTSSCLP